MGPDAAGAEAISGAIFEKILQVAADAIVTVDESQHVVHFNRGAEQIFGYEQAEMLGKSLDVLLPARFRTSHAGYVEAFGRTTETARLMGHRREVFGRRKDGTEFPAEASILKLDASDGRRLYSALVRDVTERKRIDQQQRFLAEVSGALSGSLNYDATIASVIRLPVPTLADICVIDLLDGSDTLQRFAYAESESDALIALRDRHALSRDAPAVQIDALDSRRTQVVPAVTADWLDGHTENAEEAAAFRDLRVRSMMAVALVARDQVLGVLTLMSSSGVRAYDAMDIVLAENFAGRAALAIDNATLYRDAQRATRARDDVLGVVSHDLRNPLSAIAMCSRVLVESPPAHDEEKRDLSKTIYESTVLMSRMIQDLLDVSAIEAGALSVVPADEHLAPIIARAVELFARRAAERGIEMQAHVDDSLRVRADAERLVQAVADLVANALKFTPAGGRISITARETDDEIEIAVNDTGSGIAASDLEHIFDRYWHSRGANAGAGLGLTIVKGIISAHGGRVTVASTPGVGSRFSIHLPR